MTRIRAEMIDGAVTATDPTKVAKTGDTMTGPLTLTQLNIASSADLTIASDAITPTGSFHRLSAEGGASTDDLVTINATGATIGQLLTIAQNNGTITVRSTGNIALYGGDMTLIANSALSLRWNGTAWAEMSRARRSGGISRQTIDQATTNINGTTPEFVYLEGLRGAGRTYLLQQSFFIPGDAIEFYNATTGGFSMTIRNGPTATNIATLAPGKAFRAKFVDGTIGFVPLFTTP